MSTFPTTPGASMYDLQAVIIMRDSRPGSPISDTCGMFQTFIRQCQIVIGRNCVRCQNIRIVGICYVFVVRSFIIPTAEKVVTEVAEKKAEAEVGAEKDAEVEVMEIVEEGAEAEKEDREVVAESRPKKPKGILQASPGTPPSA